MRHNHYIPADPVPAKLSCFRSWSVPVLNLSLRLIWPRAWSVPVPGLFLRLGAGPVPVPVRVSDSVSIPGLFRSLLLFLFLSLAAIGGYHAGAGVMKALADRVVLLVRVAKRRMSRAVKRWSSGGGHHGRRREEEDEEKGRAKKEEEDRTGESWITKD
jgi:hypothetical protein